MEMTGCRKMGWSYSVCLWEEMTRIKVLTHCAEIVFQSTLKLMSTVSVPLPIEPLRPTAITLCFDEQYEDISLIVFPVCVVFEDLFPTQASDVFTLRFLTGFRARATKTSSYYSVLR